MSNYTDTSRSGDLVERLRERTSYSEMLLCHPPRPAPDHLCQEAADRIEALEAENERLRAVVREIAEYTGKGPPTTPWKTIVKHLSTLARAALGEK